MNEITERRHIKKIYLLLISYCILDSYLNPIMPTTIIRFCELSCIVMAIHHEYKLYKSHRLSYPHGFAKILYVLLFLISISIVIRGNWSGNIKNILLVAISPSLMMAYLIPFIIIPLPNEKHLNTILQCFYIGSLLTIPIWIINSHQLVQELFYGEAIGKYLPFFSAFLLGFLPLFTKKKKMIIIGIWAFYFLLMMLNARRNVVFSLFLYGFIAFAFLYYNKIKRNASLMIPIVIFLLLSIATVMINWDNLTQNTFKSMSQRAKEDTRSGVEEFFFADFLTSPIEDWIWGRGMDGGYYQEMFDSETGEINTNRTAIETGYLYMILKGGIIYALIITLFIIISSKRGCSNKRTRYIGLILATYLIDSYTTIPICILTPRTILFWFCVSYILKNNPIKRYDTINRFNKQNNKTSQQNISQHFI